MDRDKENYARGVEIIQIDITYNTSNKYKSDVRLEVYILKHNIHYW